MSGINAISPVERDAPAPPPSTIAAGAPLSAAPLNIQQQQPPRNFVHPELKRIRESRGFGHNFQQFQAKGGYTGFGNAVVNSDSAATTTAATATTTANFSTTAAAAAASVAAFSSSLFNQFHPLQQQLAAFGAPFLPTAAATTAVDTNSLPTQYSFQPPQAAPPSSYTAFDTIVATADQIAGATQQQQQPQQMQDPSSQHQQGQDVDDDVHAYYSELSRQQHQQLPQQPHQHSSLAAKNTGSTLPPAPLFIDSSQVPALSFAATPARTAEVLRAELSEKRAAAETAQTKQESRGRYAKGVRRDLMRMEREDAESQRMLSALNGAISSIDSTLQFAKKNAQQSTSAANNNNINSAGAANFAAAESWCPHLVDLVGSLERNFVAPLSQSVRGGALTLSSAAAAAAAAAACCFPTTGARYCHTSKTLLSRACRLDQMQTAAGKFLAVFAPFLQIAGSNSIVADPNSEENLSLTICCVAPENLNTLSAVPRIAKKGSAGNNSSIASSSSIISFLNPGLLVLQNDVAREIQTKQFDSVLKFSVRNKIQQQVENHPELVVQPWCVTEQSMFWAYVRSLDAHVRRQLSNSLWSASVPLIYCPNLACKFRHRLEAPRRMCSVIKMLSFAAERCCSDEMARYILNRYSEAAEILRSEWLRQSVLGVLRGHANMMERVATFRKQEEQQRKQQQQQQQSQQHQQHSHAKARMKDFDNDQLLSAPLTASELLMEEEFRAAAMMETGVGGTVSDAMSAFSNSADMEATAALCAAASRTAGQLARWTATDMLNNGWHELRAVHSPPGDVGTTSSQQPFAKSLAALRATSSLFVGRNLLPSSSSSSAAAASLPHFLLNMHSLVVASLGSNSTPSVPSVTQAALLEQLTLCKQELVDLVAASAVSTGKVAERVAASIDQQQRKAALLLLLFALSPPSSRNRGSSATNARAEGTDEDHCAFLYTLLGHPSRAHLPLDPISQWNVLVVTLLLMMVSIKNKTTSLSPPIVDYQLLFETIPLANCIGTGAVPLRVPLSLSSDVNSASPTTAAAAAAALPEEGEKNSVDVIVGRYADWICHELLGESHLRAGGMVGTRFHREMISLFVAVRESTTADLSRQQNALAMSPDRGASFFTAHHVSSLFTPPETTAGSKNKALAPASLFSSIRTLADDNNNDEDEDGGGDHDGGSSNNKNNSGGSGDGALFSDAHNSSSEFWWNAPDAAVSLSNRIVGEALFMCELLHKANGATRTAPGLAQLQQRHHIHLRSLLSKSNTSGGSKKVAGECIDATCIPALRFAMQTASFIATRSSASAGKKQNTSSGNMQQQQQQQQQQHQVGSGADGHCSDMVDIAVEHATTFLSVIAAWSHRQSFPTMSLLTSSADASVAAVAPPMRRRLMRDSCLSSSRSGGGAGGGFLATVADVELRAMLADPEPWFGCLSADKNMNDNRVNVLFEFQMRMKTNWVEKLSQGKY